MLKTHVPPLVACDNMIFAMKLLGEHAEEGENQRGHEGIKEKAEGKVVAALRQFIEVDNNKALVSVKFVDQRRVVREVGVHQV